MSDAKSVSAPSRISKRVLIKWLVPLLVISIAWLGFYLLEPIITWSSGWQPLPTIAAAESLPADAVFTDEAWRDLAAPAAKRLIDARAALDAPAISAAISVGGKRVWAGAIGLADVPSQRQATLVSRFRLGSTSKAVTSVAIGTALDAGLVDLDLPVQHYIKDLAPPLATITTRQAMSHTAGVRNYGLCWCFPAWEHQNRRHFVDTRAALRVFERDPLLFVPGEKFAYSSYGYNVAGAVLESAAKTPFLDYLQHSVLTPLAMTHSGGESVDTPVAERVSFYEIEEGKYKPAYRVDNSIRLPSGGLLSTPSDMVILGNVMITEQLLSVKTRDRLLTPQRLADGSTNPQGYALGWRYSDQKKLFDGTLTTRIIHHNGTAVGSTSYFAVLPEFDLVISMMMNKGQENLDAMAPHATALVELFVAEQRRRQAIAKN